MLPIKIRQGMEFFYNYTRSREAISRKRHRIPLRLGHQGSLKGNYREALRRLR